MSTIDWRQAKEFYEWGPRPAVLMPAGEGLVTCWVLNHDAVEFIPVDPGALMRSLFMGEAAELTREEFEETFGRWLP